VPVEVETLLNGTKMSQPEAECESETARARIEPQVHGAITEPRPSLVC
jgi:hypothetical protein